MKTKLLGLLMLVSSVSFAQTDVTLQIKHFLEGEPFALNTTATNNLGNEFLVKRLEYYITEITLVHDGGQETVIPESWNLINATNDVAIDLGSVTLTTLEKVKFHIGVEQAYNHLDPTTYSVMHPLGPKSPSMHWGWTAGYRFAALEGKSGTGGALTFEIHALGDANYNEVLIDMGAVTVGSELLIRVKVDCENILKDIDVSSGPTEHSETGIAADLLVNMGKSVFSMNSDATGISEIGDNLNLITVFPNPSAGMVTIRSNNSETLHVVVLDITGKEIISKDVAGFKDAIISLDNNGMYFVNTYTNDTWISTKKLIINK